jgi:hypothetical protein
MSRRNRRKPRMNDNQNLAQFVSKYKVVLIVICIGAFVSLMPTFVQGTLLGMFVYWLLVNKTNNTPKPG